MTYARVYDQTVADDFNAMSRVEQRLELAPGMENRRKPYPMANGKNCYPSPSSLPNLFKPGNAAGAGNRMRRLLSAPEPVWVRTYCGTRMEDKVEHSPPVQVLDVNCV